MIKDIRAGEEKSKFQPLLMNEHDLVISTGPGMKQVLMISTQGCTELVTCSFESTLKESTDYLQLPIWCLGLGFFCVLYFNLKVIK